VATPHAENLGVFGSGYVDHPQGILRLRSSREGRVVEVLIQEQDLVEKGQLLFRMEDTLIQLEQRAAEKAVEVATNRVAQLEAAKAVGFGLEIAEQQRLLAEMQLELVRQKLLECDIKSPCAGKIMRTRIQVGDLISPHSLEPAMELCPAGSRVVRAEVTQEFAGELFLGQRALLHDDAGADHTSYSGRVTRLADWFAQRRNSPLEPGELASERTIECLIEFDEFPERIRIGQRMQVEFQPRAVHASRPNLN